MDQNPVKEAVDQKTVQELAKAGAEPPSRFIQNCPIDASSPAHGIPIIDLSRLFEPGLGEEELFRLKSAVQTWGMFLAVSDEMPASFLDEVRNEAKMFFNLPKEEKHKYRNVTTDREFKLEGYGNDIIVSKDQILDWNDRLYLLVQPENKRSLEHWPDNPSSFRSVLSEFTIKSRKIVDDILRVIASRLLGLEEGYIIDQLGEDAEVFARLNFYPNCSMSDVVMGMKPHSDGSLLTLVLPDKDVEGLQIFRDGEWFSVPNIPHALIINAGDQAEIISNGIVKSPMHRVVASTQERISVVMFYSINSEKYIEPANKLVDERRPRQYKKVLVKDYLKELFETFAVGKRAIDWGKL